MPIAAHWRRRLRHAAIASALAWAGSHAGAAEPQAPPLRFERVADEAPGDPATALAIASDGRLAIGGVRGVRVVAPGGAPQRWLRRGPVLDLVFLDTGALLAATLDGLYRVESPGRAVREHLVPGSELPVARLAVRRGRVVAAAASGVYLREAGARWRPLRALPRRPATLVALREDPAGMEVWAVMEGELWIASLTQGEQARSARAARIPLPTAHRSDPADDARFALPFADALLVFPGSLALRDAAGVWRTLRPPLPPGSRASRLAVAHGRLWLATDAGLLSAERPEGPWSRAEPPFGSSPVAALVGDGRAIWLATRGRVVRSASGAPSAEAVPLASGSEPAIGPVQRAALDYLDLSPERVRALTRGAATRGWLPELQVSGGYARARGRQRDYDQAFVGGGMRELFDRDREDEDDFDIGVTLSWDLGDVRFHPEEIDVLRETRAVIALRDDVLDEVTQLYFERRRVLGELSRAEDGAERAALTARADELAAGLDAWTGGWFSRRTQRVGE
jgi:hypothetical protein